MEEEEGMKKMESLLRGRLIAERNASKLAKEEDNQLQQKLEELETQLKSEIKYKKKAEKKLNFLIKKLKTLKIPYSSEELKKGGDVSSVSSSVSSSLTQVEEKDSKAEMKIHDNCEDEENEKRGMSQTGRKDFGDDISEISTSNQSRNYNSVEVDDQSLARLRSSVRKEDIDDENINQMQDESQNKPIEEKSNNQKKDEQSSCSSTDTMEEKKDTEEKSNKAQEDSADVSLALVLVDSLKEPPEKTIDPSILDANVKQVLESLSSAKQKLLLSMERRHMIRAGYTVR